jgi:endonuclease YncB( thermonuclease family)
MSLLLETDFSQIKLFSFSGLVVPARVVDVYDGDTLTVGFIYGNEPIKVKIRMCGYDSPELKPLLTVANRDLHIKCAHISRDHLLNIITKNNKEGCNLVMVHFNDDGADKYGRQLAKVYVDSLCINDYMIKNGFGKCYDGGKKGEFTITDLQRIADCKCGYECELQSNIRSQNHTEPDFKIKMHIKP